MFDLMSDRLSVFCQRSHASWTLFASPGYGPFWQRMWAKVNAYCHAAEPVHSNASVHYCHAQPALSDTPATRWHEHLVQAYQSRWLTGTKNRRLRADMTR
jgi:hypothetical protein